MNKTIRYGAAALLGLLAAPVARTAAIVTLVVDGDTFWVDINRHFESVRIAGIDTPERGECGFNEATHRLTEILHTGDTVTLTASSANDHDKYNRLIRSVEVNGGGDVGVSM